MDETTAARTDAVDYLDTDEVIAAYLDAAKKSASPALLARAQTAITTALAHGAAHTRMTAATM